MPWSKLKKLAISLPIAVAATLTLVVINELGFRHSLEALNQVEQTQSLRNSVTQLLQSMLDAETGHRGYLLTGDERYLEPYEQAISTVNTNLDQLRTLVVNSNADLSEFAQLSRQISRKLSEMDLSLRLRRDGNEDAWKFVLSTDVGLENMQAVRQHAKQIITYSATEMNKDQSKIRQSLLLSRLGISAISAIGLLAFYMYLRQTTALQKANEHQQASLEAERARLEGLVRARTESLSELASHLQQVREDERGHLARELHDELGALLTAAKLDVARLKSRMTVEGPEVAERLKHLTETLNGVIALKRRIIEDLRPSSLSNLGLTAALEILTREFADRASLDVQINIEQVTLPEPTQLTIYRMVQESLNNIVKYAGAKQVLVTVHNYPTHVAVQIRDDGGGFDLASVRRSAHGLLGMRHRVEAAGGRLTVESKLNEGTVVSAIIPVMPAAPALTDAAI
ncbi:CHASE3 domain-containing protein [Simplicispira suum]|uniref:Histidine kinase n=1 Tax=Simplicispira suum TaxID=2109915 RepID=A0A2S0N1K9_9BURK|nr:CHASE3 domain-containing protein [Simplicispira suum]AVO41927.1 histidine kinase [Simplicispira suum]